MQSQLFQELPEEKRLRALEDNSDGSEKLNYIRKYSEDEIAEKKTQLSTVSIEMDDIQEAKKAAAAQFKAELTPLNDERKKLLKNIRMRAESVTENCFKFIDHSTQMVGFYNAKGELVDQRRMLPTERQKGMFSIHGNGTND